MISSDEINKLAQTHSDPKPQDPVPPIVWTPSLSTGHQDIDEQHMLLIRMINDANAILAEDFKHSALSKITRELNQYTIYHFGTEEILMDRRDYEFFQSQERQAHLLEHKAFIDKISAVQHIIWMKHDIPKKEFLDFLNGWLTSHIMHTDMDFAKFLNKHD